MSHGCFIGLRFVFGCIGLGSGETAGQGLMTPILASCKNSVFIQPASYGMSADWVLTWECVSSCRGCSEMVPKVHSTNMAVFAMGSNTWSSISVKVDYPFVGLKTLLPIINSCSRDIEHQNNALNRKSSLELAIVR